MSKVIENLNIEEILSKKEVYIVGPDGDHCLKLITDYLNKKKKGVKYYFCTRHYDTNILNSDIEGMELIKIYGSSDMSPKEIYHFIFDLRKKFPNTIFIIITNNPMVLLGASEDAVFYKTYRDELGQPHISNQVPNKGYTLNTLASSPLFNLETVVSRSYEGVFSSDDYIYSKIHEVVTERIKNLPDIPDEELEAIINKEFEELGL